MQHSTRFAAPFSLYLTIALLGACSATPVTQVGVMARSIENNSGENKEDCNVLLTERGNLTIRPFLKKTQSKSSNEMVSLFLDCTLGSIKREDNPGDETLQKRLQYRGYVALALLSRYAYFNYTGAVGNLTSIRLEAYPGIADDAAALLGRIETADLLLRAGITQRAATGDASPGNILLQPKTVHTIPNVVKAHRTVSVLLVAVSAGRPTIERSKGYFSRLVGAIAGSVGGTTDLLEAGLTVLGKGLTLRMFGDAYLLDARKSIEQGHGTEPSEWETWTSLITEACDQLVHVSNTIHHCSQ